MRYLLAIFTLALLVACGALEPTADLTTTTTQNTVNTVTQNTTTEQTLDELLQAAVPQPAHSISGLLQLRWNHDSGQRELVVVDGEGNLSPTHKPIVLGSDMEFGASAFFSPDGRLLAAFESGGQSCQSFAGGSSCHPEARMLHLIEVANWEETSIPLPGGGYAGPIAFNEDSSQMAFAYNKAEGNELLMVDTVAGTLLSQRPLDYPLSLLGFAGDGQSLVLVGAEQGERPGISPPGETQVQLLDLHTLQPTWEQALPDLLNGFWCAENCEAAHHEMLNTMWTPAVVLSPNRMALHIVHADSDQLTTVDLQRRTVRQMTIEVAQSWFDRLLARTASVAEAKGAIRGATRQAAVSSDGTRLYLIGQDYTSSWNEERGYWDMDSVSLGLQVIDSASGRILEQSESEASLISLTPDGTQLLLQEYGQDGLKTIILNATSLTEVGVVEDYEVLSTFQIDGRVTLVGVQYTTTGTGLEMAIIGPQLETMNVIQSWPSSRQTSWVTATTP